MIFKKIKNRLILYKNIVRFRIFENKISKETWVRYNEILLWAESQTNISELELEKIVSMSDDTIVKKGYSLRQKVLSEFYNKYSNDGMNILIHIPSKENSPGGYSLFTNLAESFKFIGIHTEVLFVGEDIKEKLNKFKANVFITSDSKGYLSTIDWEYVTRYKNENGLTVGLTASIEEYGNSPLIPRLEWAKKVGIDFYYSFRAPEYFENRTEYSPFFDYGYKIISVEFGANPLLYFPISNDKDLNYIFLASSNGDKINRYIEWLADIFSSYSGFISGSGWRNANKWPSMNANKFLFSRAKVGINLHIDNQIEWASELNERTYTLAACGVPQLIDNPKLLSERFSSDAMFKVESSEEYLRMFEYMLKNPLECERRALIALEEVFGNYTTFHRADRFILKIKEL